MLPLLKPLCLPSLPCRRPLRRHPRRTCASGGWRPVHRQLLRYCTPHYRPPRTALSFSYHIVLFRPLSPAASDATHMAWGPGLVARRQWRWGRWGQRLFGLVLLSPASSQRGRGKYGDGISPAFPAALRQRHKAVTLLALLARRRARRWLGAAQRRWR